MEVILSFSPHSYNLNQRVKRKLRRQMKVAKNPLSKKKLKRSSIAAVNLLKVKRLLRKLLFKRK